MLTEFSSRTQANGKIHFGMRITKRIKSILHWVQDFYRISGDPTKVDLNKVTFIQQLETTMYKAYIRDELIDQYTTKAKEASTVPLDSENK